MNKYQIIFEDGRKMIVEGTNSLEIDKRYNLFNKANTKTRIVQIDEEIDNE